MKTLYYAVGGGLGHLKRARRVLETLGLTSQAAIITSSGDVFVAGAIPTIHVSESDSIADIIRREHAGRFIVDAFPCGIRGELWRAGVPPAVIAAGRDARRLRPGRPLSLDYVARRLRWREYKHVCSSDVHFETTYVVEELEEEHFRWIATHSASVVPLKLEVPQERAEQSDHWLIVHSGPVDEVRDLVEYARELAARRGESPRVLVATRCHVELPSGFEHVDTLPYASAARIISAAGFNVMLETEPWREKHYVVPFPRRFDDQFARAARRRQCR